MSDDTEEYPLSFDEVENEPGVYQINTRDARLFYVVVIRNRSDISSIVFAANIDPISFKPRDIAHVDVFSVLRHPDKRYRKLDHIEFSFVFSLKEKSDE